MNHYKGYKYLEMSKRMQSNSCPKFPKVVYIQDYDSSITITLVERVESQG